MKLQTMIEQGYNLRSWAYKTIRGERRVVVNLSKKWARGEKFYIVHSPHVDTILSDAEFTEPILLKEGNNGLTK
jgi:hypothetical protein